MKPIPSLAVLTALVLLGQGTACVSAAEGDGVALAIVYDTSGSMKDRVPDSTGRPAPKYQIANRALVAIAKQLEAFAAGSSPAARNVSVGLFVFDKGGARQAIKFGPFDSDAIQKWAGHFTNPSGNTPLGNALEAAGRCVLDSPWPRKHVLILTDGMNTAGPEPSAVMPRLKRQAEQKQSSVSVHFVAFDVAAKEFEPVKKLGATVVAAADEKQLNTQLEYILQRKILLEEEEKK
jgi:uncharacterized protein YegL